MSSIEQENAMLEAATRQEIKILWARYNFPDKPPPENSVVETRMIELAQDYIDCVVGSLVDKNKSSHAIRQASEIDRREKHNQLSIMIYGVPRSNFPNISREADMLSDFAAGITHFGETLESLYDKQEKS